MKSLMLMLAYLLGFVILAPKFMESIKTPTRERIIGKWQNRYDSTEVYIFSQQKCTVVQNGVQLFSESYLVYAQSPMDARFRAKVDEFGEYLWLEGKAHKADMTNPEYMKIVFKQDGSIQIGTENPNSASCMGTFGFSEYDKIQNTENTGQKSK